MRRKEKEVTNRKWMEDVICSAEICRIGIFGEEYPYIVPVNFGYMSDVLYFHSACEGRKLELIRKNPKVCFQIDTSVNITETGDVCNWSTSYRSVMAYGTARIIEDKAEKIKALTLIVNHYSEEKKDAYPFKGLDNVCIVRIDIEKMTGKQSD